MKKKIGLASIVMVLVLAGNGFCQEAVINRQILEKLEKIETKLNSMDVRIARLEEGQKNLQKQMDNLQTLVMGGFGVIFAGMFALIGFVLWDRRTALAPAVREMKTVKERDEKILRILQEFALKEPKLAAVMRNVTL